MLASPSKPFSIICMTDLHLGFEFPYLLMDFLEPCIKGVCKSPFLTGQEKDNFRHWGSSQLFLSGFQRP